MNTASKHLLMEFCGCERSLINNEAYINELAKKAVLQSGCTILKIVSHPFEPYGVSCIVVIAESHLSIHTWPEHRYVAADFHSCGNNDQQKLMNILQNGFNATSVETMYIERGKLDNKSKFGIPSHSRKELDTVIKDNILQ